MRRLKPLLFSMMVSHKLVKINVPVILGFRGKMIEIFHSVFQKIMIKILKANFKFFGGSGSLTYGFRGYENLLMFLPNC